MPDPTPNLEQALRESTVGPAKANVDGVNVEQHPLPDQIEVDRYLASKKAAAKPGMGLRITRLVPPGAEGG
jgi:hypothetical protein